ncbi:MAG: glycosyltransferase family 4 protein [Ignavibacteria bacterium]|nr:glycosyltransferase family 4 protein [Ignavibacteria bacterium]
MKSFFSKKELDGYINNKYELKNFFPFKFQAKRVPFISDKYIRNADVSIASTWPTAYAVDELNSSKGRKYYLVQGYETWNSNVLLAENSYRLKLNKITVSNYLKNLIGKKFDVNLEVIGLGMNFNEFYPKSEKNFFSDLTISYIDSPYLLKNTSTLLEILVKLKNKIKNLKVISFGFKKIRNFPDFFKFIENPTPDKIRSIYNKSHIFLYSSLQEGYGLPPAEAMACRCIPISTAVGEIPEYIQNGFNGFLVNPEKIYQMENIILKLDSSRENMMEMSNNAYKSVKDFFDWDKVTNKFESLLKKNF